MSYISTKINRRETVMNTKFYKNAAFYIFSAALSILVIWYILYHLISGFEKEVQTTPAVLATKTDNLVLDAYIVRDERVLYASVEGGVNYLYEDGERVSVNSVVANIYSGVGAAEATDRILSIDKKVDVLEKSSVKENATKTDTKAIDDKINELYYIIRDKIEDGDIEYAMYKKDELLTYLNKRQIITQNVTGYDEQIIALIQEKEALTGQLINLEEKITVSNAGYFYSEVDGYESIFDVSKIEDMTYETYSGMVDSEPIITNGSLSVGKIVNSNEWYILSEITKDDLKKFNKGNTYPVKFPYNADATVVMTLEKIIEQSDSNQAVLVFKTNTMPDGFNYMRKQSIQIVEESYTGYKIPVNAVRVVDDVRGVYILSGNTVRFKEIEVLIEQDGYFIVKEQPTYLEDENYHKKLGLYDMVITSGKNLYDGKIISNAGVE